LGYSHNEYRIDISVNNFSLLTRLTSFWKTALDHTNLKKIAQATGPVREKKYIFKGGQYLSLAYPIYISLLLQENDKKITFL
jgi:hypothetical protein